MNSASNDNRYPHVPWSGFDDQGYKRVPTLGEVCMYDDQVIMFTGVKKMDLFAGDEDEDPFSEIRYVYIDLKSGFPGSFYHEESDPAVICQRTAFNPL